MCVLNFDLKAFQNVVNNLCIILEKMPQKISSSSSILIKKSCLAMEHTYVHEMMMDVYI